MLEQSQWNFTQDSKSSGNLLLTTFCFALHVSEYGTVVEKIYTHYCKKNYCRGKSLLEISWKLCLLLKDAYKVY